MGPLKGEKCWNSIVYQSDANPPVHIYTRVLMLTQQAACVSGRPGKSPAYSWLCAVAHVSPLLCFDRPHDRMCSAKKTEKKKKKITALTAAQRFCSTFKNSTRRSSGVGAGER